MPGATAVVRAASAAHGHNEYPRLPATYGRGMNDYVECRDCGFVLAAADSPSRDPKHWDACPDCGGTEFGRVGE
ncbi:hypothetical protein JCM30237_14320 [Halolamina litorea]